MKGVDKINGIGEHIESLANCIDRQSSGGNVIYDRVDAIHSGDSPRPKREAHGSAAAQCLSSFFSLSVCLSIRCCSASDPLWLDLSPVILLLVRGSTANSGKVGSGILTSL